MAKEQTSEIRGICEAVLGYLMECQDTTPGEFYGSFWSEKAYHAPVLDYHAGGSHHNRTAGSAGLALWLVGKARGDAEMMRRAEMAFDWLAARQRPNGGYHEIQHHEQPSDWEHTGLEECCTIPLGFAIHGLGNALLTGLPPKKLYADCLQKAGHWQLGLEWPPGSGIFPHHDRSPYDTLNANTHAAETLATVYTAMHQVYGRRLNIFHRGARRAVGHTLPLQWPNGCFPYRAGVQVTINYTSLVVWCLLNCLDVVPEPLRGDLAPTADLKRAFTKAAAFLRSCVGRGGALKWENETTAGKNTMWTYVITYSVLRRLGGTANAQAAARLLRHILARRTDSGMLPMWDVGEDVVHCAYYQADMLMFLLPYSGLVEAA